MGRGLRRASGGRCREGDFDKRAAAAVEEDKPAGQDGGRATWLWSRLLVGFEMCYIR